LAAAVNWIRTVPGRGWLGGFRFYSPTEEFFKKDLKPGDIEKIKQSTCAGDHRS
jgi:hypothetical protein